MPITCSRRSPARFIISTCSGKDRARLLAINKQTRGWRKIVRHPRRPNHEPRLSDAQFCRLQKIYGDQLCRHLCICIEGVLSSSQGKGSKWRVLIGFQAATGAPETEHGNLTALRSSDESHSTINYRIPGIGAGSVCELYRIQPTAG